MSCFSNVFKVAVFAACSVCVHAQDSQQPLTQSPTGEVVRKVIPYGGGAALGAIARGQVDLLTVESLDEHDGYHGVVLAVPFQKAAAIRDELTSALVPHCKASDAPLL